MKQIRVIAPSDSWKPDREPSYERAQQRLLDAGFYVTFSQHVKAVAHLGTADARKRAEDLNAAFRDTEVVAVIALHGGFSANEVLPYVDWELIKSNPKPLIGYSDITVLLNAIFAKTGVQTYLGPNLGTIGHEHLWEYTLTEFISALKINEPFALKPSPEYIDDKMILQSESWLTIQHGTGKGVLIGGNIQTFFLLQGTEYQPEFDDSFILAIEDDSLSKEYTLHGLSRNLESILQLPNARQNIKGIMIGRFEVESKVTHDDLRAIMTSKGLGEIPIVANLDFGHTIPMATLRIGATVCLSADDSKISIEFK